MRLNYTHDRSFLWTDEKTLLIKDEDEADRPNIMKIHLLSKSCEEAFSPSDSTDTTLNPPSGPPGMVHQVLVAAPNALEGGQRGKHAASNMCKRGLPIAGNDREGV